MSLVLMEPQKIFWLCLAADHRSLTPSFQKKDKTINQVTPGELFNCVFKESFIFHWMCSEQSIEMIRLGVLIIVLSTVLANLTDHGNILSAVEHAHTHTHTIFSSLLLHPFGSPPSSFCHIYLPILMLRPKLLLYRCHAGKCGRRHFLAPVHSSARHSSLIPKEEQDSCRAHNFTKKGDISWCLCWRCCLFVVVTRQCFDKVR